MLKKIKGFFRGKFFAPIMFLVSFLYFGLFRILMIPSGDDYFWGGEQGAYLIRHMFYGPQAIYGGSSNGRYFGNTLEIFTMHSLPLAAFSYGLFWTLLLWTMWRLAGKSITALLLSLAFVFTLQGAFINNVLAWNAGFVNYVPPMALVLSYLVIVDYGQKKILPWLFALLTLVLGYSAGLFTEALTLGQICLAVLVILYFNKQTKLYHITYLLGTIVSAIVMFSHPGYHGKSTYRGTTFDPKVIWSWFSNVTHFWLITFNIVLLAAILLAILTLVLKSDFSRIKKISMSIISTAFLFYYAIANAVLSTIPKNDMYGYNSISLPISVTDTLVSLLLVIFIGYSIFTFYKTDAKMWLYFLMTGVIAGQLLFVSAPVNCRGYFLTYVFMYLIAIRFVVDAFSKVKFINWVMIIAVIVMGVSYQSMLYQNRQVNLERVSDPQFYNGKKALTKHVPYRQFVWSNDLLNQQNPTYWKNYLKR